MISGLAPIYRDVLDLRYVKDNQEITEQMISDHLYTAGQPDVDLLIRTSGEMRLSNYLMWQLAYAELYFTDVYWPDFHKEDLIRAIDELKGRVGHFDLGLWNLYAFVFSKSDIRLDSNLGCKDKRFARLKLDNCDLRLGNDLQIALLHCLAVLLRDHIVGCILKEDACAIHPLDHLAGCFSFTEARKRNTASGPKVNAVHRFFHCLR